jgi:hypothetical protein
MRRIRPFDGEREAGPWTVRPLCEVSAGLVRLAASRTVAPGPPVIAIDGRSGAGKSTFAARLASAVGDAAVVRTDDVAWNHSFFGWADLMRAGVLEPVRRGEAVSYSPPAWVERGRPGAVEVRAGVRAVVVEGVGAGRRELADLVDALVWVQSDAVDARTRGIARDGGDVAFWDEWEVEEVPFLDHHRPWERADVIVAGSPVVDHDPAVEVVVAPALVSS